MPHSATRRFHGLHYDLDNGHTSVNVKLCAIFSSETVRVFRVVEDEEEEVEYNSKE